LALLAAVLLLLGAGRSFALTLSNASVSTPANTAVSTTLSVTFGVSEFPPVVASISSGPSHGTAVVSATGPASVTVTYSPTTGFAGADAFTVVVGCSACLPATGTVSITVGSAIDSSLSGMIGAIQQTTLLSTYAQIDNFNRHFEQLHDVLRNHQALGVSINGQSSPDSSFHIASLASMLAPAGDKFASDAPRAGFGPQTAQANASDAVPIELPDRIGVFLNGNLSLHQITGTNGRPDASPRITALSGGVDYRLNAGTILGIGAGYTGGTTDIGGGSKATSNAFNITGYGTTRPLDPVYVDALVGYSHISFDTVRNSSGAAVLFGSPDGNAFWGNVTGGYEFDMGPYTFGPYVRGEGVHAVINAFTETGSSAFAVTAGRQSVDSAKAVLGFRGDRAISTDYGIVSPHIRAEYLHEFIGTPGVSVAFASVAPSTFQVVGYPVSRNYFTLGGGVSFLTVSALSFFVDYDALVGYTDQTSHTITGGASIRF
jgi:uncharacterized protein YhjY with autotransporter beta-barrel domain